MSTGLMCTFKAVPMLMGGFNIQFYTWKEVFLKNELLQELNRHILCSLFSLWWLGDKGASLRVWLAY